MSDEPRNCPDCGAKPGEFHDSGCDVERCSVCNGQWIGCGHLNHDPSKVLWTGFWPGVLECRERGWYSYADPDGPGPYWKQCDKDHPGAGEDLNRWARHNIKHCPDEPSWDEFHRAGEFAGTFCRHLQEAGIEPHPLLAQLGNGGELPMPEDVQLFLRTLDAALRDEFSAFPEIMES